MRTFRKELLLVVLAGMLGALIPLSPPSAEAAEFDLWPDANTLPPAADLVYLSPLGSDHAFVDLGFNVTRDGREWRALQFTRDQRVPATTVPGKYLFGFVGDEWPHQTVEVLDELRRGRMTALVVDGQTIPIGPPRLLDLSTPDKAAAVYNAFPRLLVGGHHSLQYVWEQKQDFFFVLPLGGAADPLGLGGRRVFVKGEVVGDTLDGRLVVTYDLNPAPVNPACADGQDNDGDALIDFPADPGCADPLSLSESADRACSDGADNDGDGFVDHPQDPDCYAATDPSEATECADGVDNDGDQQVDAADPDCRNAEDRVEAAAAECADGTDNDGDGLVDHPSDAGCAAANDDAEDASGPSQPGDVRLLVAFASSGSLNGDACSGLFTGGDGSIECPGADVACNICNSATCGNGFPDDSRLHQVKRSLSELLLRTDAEFGLLGSRQRAADFACPTASPVTGSGGWQGGGASPCGGGFEAGDLLVSFSGDNFWLLQGYMDGDDNYGPGFPPPPLDFELRATGSRPLAALLTGAGGYLEYVRAGDPVVACRPYAVVLLADGGESCTGDPVAAAAALSNDGVRTYVVGYAVPSAEVRAALNVISAAGGTGEASFVEDHQGLSLALDNIADSVRDEGILVELCNGVDDDCDNLVDEGYGIGQPCDNGLLGVCRREGVTQCASNVSTECALAGYPVPPSTETCNGVDDDCDGFVDEQGVCGAPELCNALDDDGDGLVDEDFPVGTPCHDGGIGVCRGTGSFQCLPDQSGVFCNITQPGSNPAASDPTCDGQDDDCDGSLDEDAVGDMVTVGAFRIDRYEASRPDATGTDEGRMEYRACSKPGALPWRGTWTQAAAQCAAAGKRLCTEQEWQDACEGAMNYAYPYGNSYSATACNGRDRDPAGDVLLPTGSLPSCVSSAGVLDLSGNLAEWTATLGAPPDERVVRGGAFDSYAPGLTCQLRSDEHEATPLLPYLGFRCCADGP